MSSTTIESKVSELTISLLQLQRSALIDTQTIMQLLIDKGVCELDDIIETRSKIESESEDVKRINKQIESCGGHIIHTPLPQGQISKKAELKKQLDQLQQLLMGQFSDET